MTRVLNKTDGPRCGPYMLAGTALALCAFYALLWSPWWYPLSDSALYLNMGRALAQGKGLESMRQLHRDVRPMTPLLLCGIMRAGGRIGAMHGAMIGLTLLSHALAFLTLRRWFDERTALLAVVATATSWWVYANAFSIMTEPLFLVMFWAAMLALSHVPEATRGKQWALVVVAALCMAGAWENRVAAALALPGIFFGLWMSNRKTGWGTRAGWVAVFVIVFAVLLWDYRRPTSGAQVAAAKEETYHLNVLVGIHHAWELPVSAGRWVIEGMAAASAAPFDVGSKPVLIVAGVAMVIIFLVACVGWRELWRRRCWYAVGMALYFLPHVALWGARIKPRYMAPIAPVLFVQLWAGLGTLISQFRFGIADRTSPHPNPLPGVPGRGNRIGVSLLVVLLAMNVVPYAIEVYIRHGTALNFYDVARRGVFAELVDIGAHVERTARPTDGVWVNWPPPSSRPADANFAPDRRIVQFLTDREVHFMAGDQGSIAGPEDREKLTAFFQQVPGDWAVVYYSGRKWPSYHWPLVTTEQRSGPRWWQLFHRDAASGRFEAVDVRRQRDYVRGIPGWRR